RDRERACDGDGGEGRDSGGGPEAARFRCRGEAWGDAPGRGGSDGRDAPAGARGDLGTVPRGRGDVWMGRWRDRAPAGGDGTPSGVFEAPHGEFQGGAELHRRPEARVWIFGERPQDGGFVGFGQIGAEGSGGRRGVFDVVADEGVEGMAGDRPSTGGGFVEGDPEEGEVGRGR